MKIMNGSTRVALVGEKCTVKFQKFNDAGKFFREAVGIRPTRDDLKFLKWAFNQHIFKYVHTSFLEFLYSWKLRGIVVPTRFSLLGIMNVQDSAEPFGEFSDGELGIMSDNIKDVMWAHEHVTFFAKNYGIHHGKLKFMDYGSKALILALIQNKDIVRKTLDAVQQLRMQTQKD